MNWIFKNKNKRAKTLLVVLFLAFGFSFVSFDDAKAAGICESGSTEKTCECFNGSASLSFFPAGHNISDFNAQLTTGFCHQESCMQYCMFKFPATTAVKYDGGTFGTSSIKNSSSAVISAPSLSEQVCGGTLSMFNPSTWLQCALIMVLQLVGYLFAIAATLFAWAIDPSNVSGPNGILEKQAIKDVWIMVRDLLNMTFILILLFSAFCTIFQIDNWGLKKVWLNILINALLVNFSFPIARFIIDISNVTFYYFVKHLFASTGTSTVTGSTIFSSFASTSGIGDLLQPDKYADHAIPYLIASIIFVFIFGMTLLIIGALFIVRLVALAMLIMFSPIGFVGYIFPESASYANKWWKNLFSYSFFAPIMIFVMAISLRIMQALQAENMSSMQAISGVNAVSDQQGWVANAAFYTIPIIILWGGMGIAKSSGIAGADTVVNSVKKGGKWAATNLSGYGYMKKNYDAYAGARKKRVEEKDKKRWGGKFGDGVNDKQDKLLAKLGSEAAMKRYNKRKETGNKDDIKDGVEGAESRTADELKSQIKTSMNSTTPLSDKEKMDYAINAKLALNRGAKYESGFEEDLKADMKNNLTTDSRFATLHASTVDLARAEMNFNNHPKNPPTATGTSASAQRNHQIQMAKWTADRTLLKEAHENAKKKVESDEKKIIQSEKTKHLDNLRKAIKDAEEVGKINKPAPTPAPPGPTPTP